MSQLIRAKAAMRLTNLPCIQKTAMRLGYNVTKTNTGWYVDTKDAHRCYFNITQDGEISYTRDRKQTQDHVDRFMQGYTIEEQRLIAEQQGYFLSEHVDAETGDIVLSAHAY